MGTYFWKITPEEIGMGLEFAGGKSPSNPSPGLTIFYWNLLAISVNECVLVCGIKVENKLNNV